MFSIDHPEILPPQPGYTRISLDTSGCVLSPFPGPSKRRRKERDRERGRERDRERGRGRERD